MARNISALEDASIIRYQRRAKISEIEDIPLMINDAWKTRLAQGIKAKKLTQRAVSIAAGNGPGYVNSLLKSGKDPTVENLIKVCEAAGLSLYWVLYGVEMDPQTEEILRLATAATPAKRQALLQLLRDESRNQTH